MRILLTGLSGFLASHLVDHILNNTDHEIVSLDRIEFGGNLNRLQYIPNWETHKHRVKYIWHDLKAEINDSVCDKIGHVDVIMHLAAATHVDRSILDPMSFVMDNVVGCVTLLEYARKHPVKLFHYFSTDEVYGDTSDGHNSLEGDPHRPRNAYAASKAAAEDFCMAYANTYKVPMLITNTMNLFGQRQHKEKFLPLVIGKVLRGEKVTIHGYPDGKRAGSRFYIHCRNVSKASMFLVEKFAKEGVKNWFEQYNIVGEREMDNVELAQTIANIVGKPLIYEITDFHSARPGHDLRYSLDGEKLKTIYQYETTIDEDLIETVNRYLDNRDWL